MHHSHHVFHFFRNRELNELYASIAIRSFSISLVGIFIPIYLYQLGYSFSLVFMFFAFAVMFKFLFLYPGAKTISSFGVKRSILISIPFLIIFFAMLFTLDSFKWALWLLALPLGIHTALFWLSYHTDFSKFSKKNLRGRQVGVSTIVIGVSSVLGPIVGGIILTFLGFHVLFIAVSLLLLASSLPLFMSKEIHEKFDLSFEGFFKQSKARNVLSYLGRGIENRIGTVVWPLFVFVFIFGERYISLGTLTSLSLGVAMIATFVIGKYTDGNRKMVLKLGIFVNSIVWFLKSFATIPWHVFILDGFYGASQPSIQVPFDAINYDKAKNHNRLRVVFEREFYISLGASVFLFAAAFLTDHLIQLFRYAGPAASLIQLFF